MVESADSFAKRHTINISLSTSLGKELRPAMDNLINDIKQRDKSIEDDVAESIANWTQHGDDKVLDPFMQEIANNFANAIRSGEWRKEK